MTKINQIVFNKPAFIRIIPDILACALGLGIAWLFKWKTADLIWSLWLGSLVLGYLTILSMIAAPAYLVLSARIFKEIRLIGAAGAFFYLAFFSIHFCGFHAAHAAFLSSFFPLDGLSKNVFSRAMLNPFLLWKTAFQYIVPSYGLFLIPTIIAERKYVFASLIKVCRSDRTAAQKLNDFKSKAPKGSPNDLFLRPYINVIRMQLLILFFVFCHSVNLENFIVFALVYLVYFFPWRAFSGNDSAAGIKNEPEPIEV